MATGIEPQLSSVSTTLEELTNRITGLADEAAGARQEDLAGSLYEIERALKVASRRLEQLLARSR